METEWNGGHEWSAKGAQKIMLAFFALFIGGIIIALGVFVVKRINQVEEVCESEYIEGVYVGEICEGEESED